LPSSRLFNTYASTETGIVCTHAFNHGLRDPRCLGRPMKHAHVRITDDGRIACRGDMVMTGYLGQPALTRERFSDGWLVTDDLGEKDADGCLHFKGRQGEIINIGGYKVSPIEVEQAARGVPCIADCVLVAAQLPLGTVLKLIYTSDSGQPLDHRVMARQLAAQLERYKVPMCYEHVASLHYTFNGKVDRKAYR
jgi:long-chain acyl-CoA synthetase